MFTTVQLPLMDDHLGPKKVQQLDRLTARDTTVIQRYLTIIAQEEAPLWQTGGEGCRLDKTKLDALTLTSKAQKRTQPYLLQCSVEQKSHGLSFYYRTF